MRMPLVLVTLAMLAFATAAPARAAAPQQLWKSTYPGAEPCGAAAEAPVVDPDSGDVYVIAQDGLCELGTTRVDVVAYSPSGAQLWAVDSGGTDDVGVQLAVDPASHDVVVASDRGDRIILQDWSSAGAKRWVRGYSIANSTITVSQLVVDGQGRAFVGATVVTRTNADFLTLSYLVSSGATLWHTRYSAAGFGQGFDAAYGLAVDSDLNQVYVTGASEHGTNLPETTVAYAAGSGTRLWVTSADEDVADAPIGPLVDPSSHRVYAISSPDAPRYLTVRAYTPAGTLVWTASYGGGVAALAAALDPGSGQVLVAGESDAGPVLLAVSPAGLTRWATTDTADPGAKVHGIAVDAANHRAYVTAFTDHSSGGEIATVAYSGSGARLWRAVHSAPVTTGYADPFGVTVDPARAHVYVAGEETRDDTGDFRGVTLAYAP